MHMDFSKCIKSYYSNFKGSHTFATFINIKDIDMSGKNYFAAHEGASLISLKSSAMTITGNLTVIAGKAFEGGGMKLVSFVLERTIGGMVYQQHCLSKKCHTCTQQYSVWRHITTKLLDADSSKPHLLVK